MFASLLKEHQKSQEDLKQEIHDKRFAAEHALSMNSLGSVVHLNEDIARAYVNQFKIDTEFRKMQENIAKLSKNSDQWVRTCRSLNEAVKDLGDIRVWTNTVEKDVKYVAKAIEESYRSSPSSSDRATS